MSRTRDFVQVDVFSATPFYGNPLAVILDAEGLTEAQMQQIASWTNLSETTFVLPSTDPAADYRVRIFTPTGELPFAGHPTLGTAYAWLENGGTPLDRATITQQCAAGLVTIRQDGDKLYFAAPATVRSGELDAEILERIQTSLGVAREDIIGHQWADNGPGWSAVQLKSAEQVLALKPDFTGVQDLKFGVIGAYPQGHEFAFEIRAFLPDLHTEDPVTGSLNASVAQWLHRTGQVSGSYRVSQGTVIGRAGDVHISCEDDGTIWVGGAVTTCFRGTANA